MPVVAPRNGAVAAAIRNERPMPAAQVANNTPDAQALYQYNCRQLEELHGKGNRRKQTDREIAGAELHKKAGQKHSGCQRPWLRWQARRRGSAEMSAWPQSVPSCDRN